MLQHRGDYEKMPISDRRQFLATMAEQDTNGRAEMRFDVVVDDRTAFVTIVGELDINSVDGIESAVDRLAGAEADRLVIDLSGLRFADSSAIAVWVRWASAFEEIELRDPTPLLRKVIETMGLAEALHLTP